MIFTVTNKQLTFNFSDPRGGLGQMWSPISIFLILTLNVHCTFRPGVIYMTCSWLHQTYTVQYCLFSVFRFCGFQVLWILIKVCNFAVVATRNDLFFKNFMPLPTISCRRCCFWALCVSVINDHYTKSLLTHYLTNHLSEFCQIYNEGAVGDIDKLSKVKAIARPNRKRYFCNFFR